MADNDMTWKGELTDLTNLEAGLTDWEQEFVEKVAGQACDEKWTPSEAQKRKIGQIWDMRC